MSSKALRAALTVEALIISGIVAFLLAYALIYGITALRPNPQVVQTTLDANLCGSVLVIKNVGKHPAKIDTVVADGLFLSNMLNLPITLAPGQDVRYRLPAAYSSITITGENFNVLNVKNSCM